MAECTEILVNIDNFTKWHATLKLPSTGKDDMKLWETLKNMATFLFCNSCYLWRLKVREIRSNLGKWFLENCGMLKNPRKSGMVGSRMNICKYRKSLGTHRTLSLRVWGKLEYPESSWNWGTFGNLKIVYGKFENSLTFRNCLGSQKTIENSDNDCESKNRLGTTRTLD